MPVIEWGTELHPEGRYQALVESVELPERESPFGPWLRVTFETSWGTVTTMMSPAYAEGTDLRRLAELCLGEATPWILNTSTLLGCRVPIVVRHQREHGALMAVAHLE